MATIGFGCVIVTTGLECVFVVDFLGCVTVAFCLGCVTVATCSSCASVAAFLGSVTSGVVFGVALTKVSVDTPRAFLDSNFLGVCGGSVV